MLEFALKGICMKQKKIHKRLLSDPCASTPDLSWLDIDRYAWIEVTSEEKGVSHRIRAAGRSESRLARGEREFSESG